MIMSRKKTSMTSVIVAAAVVLSVVLAAVYLHFVFNKDVVEASPNVAEVTVREGDSLRVGIIGDSVDAGYYASEERLGFHQLVVDEWRKGGPVADFPMAALIGGTAGDVLKNPVFPSGQQLFIVELGTNDASRVDYNQFRAEYSTLLDRLQAASPDAGFVCMGVWRPKTSGETFDLIIKDLCEIRGGVFVSLSDLAADDALKGPPGVMTFAGESDSFHPNDVGHRAIADRVLGAVRVNR